MNMTEMLKHAIATEQYIFEALESNKKILVGSEWGGWREVLFGKRKRGV